MGVVKFNETYLVGGDWNGRHWMWGDTFNSLKGRELAESISVIGAQIRAPLTNPHVSGDTAVIKDLHRLCIIP